MNTATIIEIVGYIGSALVLVSFLMTSVFKLRVVNTVGSLIFMTYALIIRSYPTAIMNFCLVLINLRFLWKMSHATRAYELVEVSPTDGFFTHLLATYGDDIRACFPGISLNADTATRAFVTTCDNTPVALFMAEGTPEECSILLDYSVPEYRDFSIGKFLFPELKKRGVQKVTFAGPTEHHLAYLHRMGFAKEDGVYAKRL